MYFKNIISFLLSVSFPRTRREVPSLRGDRGMPVYTGQNHFCRFCSHLFSLLSYLLTLAPSVSSADTLAKDKASHSLLQRRFAPRKVVHLLPVKRGRLTVCMLCFFIKLVGTAFLCESFLYFLFFQSTFIE